MSDQISTLLHLQHRARDAASAAELSFIAVNETHALVPYRQAVLWEAGKGITAVSGVAVPERTVPFMHWIDGVCRTLAARQPDAGPVSATVLPDDDREEWRQWLPAAAFWQPLSIGAVQGGLLLARDTAWSEADALVLAELSHAYGHALGALRPPARGPGFLRTARGRRRSLVAAGIAVALLAAMPVPLTVLAPAEIVAVAPAIIRAPMDGVVDRIHVQPNQRVEVGQPLFDLDDTTLRGKLEVAQKALDTAEAELRQLSQQALMDAGAKPRLAATMGRREEKAAEAAYLSELSERIRVRAPQGGIAVLDHPGEWSGRPVMVGEKVLALAEENDTEIEAWLSPGDMIELPPGAAVAVFLNADPLAPVGGTVRYVAYETTHRPDDTAAYRLRATLAGSDHPRLGSKGTARISGMRVPLVYWLLRRPWAAVRSSLGI